ncbi:hypothetical protein Pmar_PMAR009842 [Perkinsus marinus ATCC 50983]|uniref:Uncharacterized protein n=1 Tax=Perkinsus marinus (strain ATCC 50983 / TXsc) TaxID=423536 RepID=C5KV81_PERM5|nr:hypothetical protein Pmar_PMAR009842 [Perkinsus marinus ATCC 50983]EER11627.1 hypothetical protein Pmar_PMAR009842 [Perkinsus marinus ATCC 50983]|eukprot:XP_002779832.1 hypothetical protein Pmar_PMAR009842 [Perkinsus marinus ATCC 50983]
MSKCGNITGRTPLAVIPALQPQPPLRFLEVEGVTLVFSVLGVKRISPVTHSL